MRRAAAGALVALAGLALLAAPAAAQRTSLTVGAGAAAASRLLLDGNGTTVRLAPAPYAALDAVRPLRAGRSVLLGATARAAWAPVRVSTPETAWRAGSAWQTDATVGLLRPVSDAARVRAALGVTLLAGPADVRPFGRTIVSPLVEVGVDLEISRAVRVDARAQAYRLAPDGGAAGGIVRALVGMSYAP